jgi:(R,R)-butanediol dehydrogenase / meso-butanediol dehydrogenase / diacetyl reductase
MKKAVYHGIRDVRIEDVADPVAGPGEVKVKLKYVGICGSDLHEYLHGPFPQSPFGHEGCGIVEAVGPGVSGVAVGDRVCTVHPGAFAAAIACPVEKLIPIPEGMDWRRAAVLEPLSGAAYAIGRGGVLEKDTVLIAGAGTVGLMFLLGFKAMGLKTIYMTDIVEKRRRTALALGAAQAWNPDEVKIPGKVKEVTGGRGVDVAVEAVGIEATLKDCLASVRYQGKVIVQGIFTGRASMHMLGFVTRETTMIGTASIDPALALNWLESGKIQPESIVTDTVSLDQIVARGFEVMAGRNPSAIKILIEL